MESVRYWAHSLVISPSRILPTFDDRDTVHASGLHVRGACRIAARKDRT